jgi:hypothetical protein
MLHMPLCPGPSSRRTAPGAITASCRYSPKGCAPDPLAFASQWVGRLPHGARTSRKLHGTRQRSKGGEGRRGGGARSSGGEEIREGLTRDGPIRRTWTHGGTRCGGEQPVPGCPPTAGRAIGEAEVESQRAGRQVAARGIVWGGYGGNKSFFFSS